VNLLTQSFLSQGYYIEDARQLAYKMVDLIIFKQQSLISYNNIFWMVALAVLFCMPLIFLIRYHKRSGTAPVDVHLD